MGIDGAEIKRNKGCGELSKTAKKPPGKEVATDQNNNKPFFHHGTPTKKRLPIFKLVAGIFIFAVLLNAFISDITPPTREKRIDRLFGLDGSHRGLVTVVKQSMNDPDSFQHMETSYQDNGQDSINVRTIYRGKNKFGGVVKNWIWAKSDLDGNIIEIISQGIEE